MVRKLTKAEADAAGPTRLADAGIAVEQTAAPEIEVVSVEAPAIKELTVENQPSLADLNAASDRENEQFRAEYGRQIAADMLLMYGAAGNTKAATAIVASTAAAEAAAAAKK